METIDDHRDSIGSGIRAAGHSVKTEGTPTSVEKSTGSQDILSVLEKSGHNARRLPNGLILATRMMRLKGTRGVHLEICHVLDLRNTRLGKTSLAVQSAVLDTVRRNAPSIMKDLEMDRMREQNYRTIAGKVSLRTLNRPGSVALVHETRSTYVVHEGPKPSTDFSWFTDPARVVSVEDFQLVRQSDVRATSNEVPKAIDVKKWQLLEKSLKGWYTVLAFLTSVVGVFALFSALLHGASYVVPVAVTLCGVAASLTGVVWTRRNVQEFRDAISSEASRLDGLGDGRRLEKALDQNASLLRMVGDLNFILSPLAITAAQELANRDIDSTVRAVSEIIDECVRASPGTTHVGEATGDEGLEKFLGLFRSIGGLCSEQEAAQLALAYVAISSHAVSRLTEDELLRHLTPVNYAMYEVGLLRPDAKDLVDTLLNRRAADSMMESTVVEPGDTEGVDDSEGVIKEIDDSVTSSPQGIEPERAVVESDVQNEREAREVDDGSEDAA